MRIQSLYNKKYKFKKYNKILIIFGVLIALMIGPFVIVNLSGLKDPENQLLGNNSITYYYESTIGGSGYENILDAVKSKDENYESEESIANIITGNVTIVFQKGADNYTQEQYLIGYEFIKKKEIYYYSGEKKLYIGKNDNESKYTWEDTIRADLSTSTRKIYKSMFIKSGKYTALPAWGVSNQSNVIDVLIDGQSIDQTIPLEIDGESYYLWIIKDLQTEQNAKSITIEMKDEE